MANNQIKPENGNLEEAFLNVKNTPIIVDSCVLLYCEANVFKTEIRKILRVLADNKNNLKISGISTFEVLKNAKVENWGYFTHLFDYIGVIDIDTDIIFNSLTLSKSYAHQPVNSHQKISSADYIIGGTTIYLKGFLFTADIEHFPLPLWRVIAHGYVTYKLSKYEVINLYLLEPNIELISDLRKKCIEVES